MMNRYKLRNISIVAAAYARTEGKELPSTYVAENPKTIYVLKESKMSSPRGLKEDYDLYDFDDFRPYIKEVRRDTSGICYDLCDEFMALLRKA
jgi:hypothetical protein